MLLRRVCVQSPNGEARYLAALQVSILSLSFGDEASWRLFECGSYIVGIKFYRTTRGLVLLTTFAEIQQTMEVYHLLMSPASYL